jgi:hypothetical protein
LDRSTSRPPESTSTSTSNATQRLNELSLPPISDTLSQFNSQDSNIVIPIHSNISNSSHSIGRYLLNVNLYINDIIN